MKAKPQRMQQEVEKAADAAKTLLKDSIVSLVEASKAHPTVDQTRLFFPNGIQWIDVHVVVTGVVDVHLTVSGLSKPSLTAAPNLVKATDPQKVIDSCEKYWDQYKSDCSGFVKAVAADFGITLTGQADHIVDQMNSGDWEHLPDGPAAKEKAEAGKFVLAGLKGADHNPPRDHGHIVVVVKGELAHAKYPTAYWGSLGGVGEKNKTLNFAWKAVDKDNVIYRCKGIS